MSDKPALPAHLHILAASIAGMVAQFVGQPFDVVKFRHQTSGRGVTIGQVISETWGAEGVRCFAFYSLFLGLLPPLVAETLFNTVVFGTYVVMKKVVFQIKNEDVVLTNTQSFVSGLAAGTSGSLVIGPTELIKVQLSLSRTMGNERRRPLPILKEILRDHGVKGLTRGLGMTWIRDCPSVGVYFWAYESLKSAFTKDQNISFAGQILAGGGAGCLSWFSTYPIDVIKTHIQTGKSSSIKGAVQSILQADGPKGFLKGALPCIVRAFPVNATIFCIYEKLVSIWRK